MTTPLEVLEDQFIAGLRKNNRLFIYYNLFSLLRISDPDFLKDLITEYETDSEDFFRVFHKSFRHLDVFSSDFCKIKNGVLSDENSKKRKDILDMRKAIRQAHDPSDESFYDEPEYKELGRQLSIVSQELRKIYIVESIGGHLDSIFYETISNDDSDDLYRYMRSFFKENAANVENV